MPKKISLLKMREWLDAYERGKSEASIAHDDRRDVRTVKRGIEQARRERDSRSARTALLKDALHKHQEDLFEVISSILEALTVLHVDLRIPSDLEVNSPPIELTEATIEITPSQSTTVYLSAEKDHQWELLEEHMKRDPVMRRLDEWKNAIASEFEARIALKRKVIEILKDKTKLDVLKHIDHAPEKGYIYPAGVDMLYGLVLKKVLGVQEVDFSKKNMVVSGPYLKYKDLALVYASPSVEVYIARIADAYRVLLEVPEAKTVVSKHRFVEDINAKARRAWQDLRFLRYVPGQCRICRRLGL